MALGTWLLLGVILLAPPASVAGLVVWTRRLSGAPRFAVRVAHALVGVASLSIGAVSSWAYSPGSGA
jgi:hypothetical protein